MIELIPKFLRLPLNKLYNSIVHRAQEFPSLTLQFYLGHYFASRELLALDPLSVESQQHVRTFFSKALYAIHRLGGLTVTELNLPEARRFERYQYLTVNDEDPMPVMKVLTTGVQRLIMIRQKIQKLQHNEQSIRKIKRQEYRVLMEVDLTVERVLEDLFKGYRNQLLQDSDTVTEAQVISQTLWLPDTVPLLDPWEREALEDHLRLITSPDYLDQLPQPERYLIDYWPILAEESSLRGETLAMLEATGIEDPVEFKQEVLLRIAQKHKLIVEQNVQLIFDQIGQRITRMLRLGSLTPEMLVEQRYGDFHLHVLPYIYYFGTKDAHQNDLWVRSPYPCSKMTYLMRLLNKPDFEANPAVKGNRVDLALTQALLQELQRVESLQFDSAIEPEHPTHPGTALGSYPPTESSTLLEDPESEALYLSAPDSLLQL